MDEKLILGFLKKALGIEFIICCLAIGALVLSGSTLAVLALLHAGISSACIFMLVYTMRFAVKGDLNQYPYGMGRLENAADFSFHLLLLIGTSLALIHIVQELLHPKHGGLVVLGWVEGLYLLSAAGSAVMALLSKQVLKTGHSTLLHSLQHSYVVRAWHKACAALLIPLLAHFLHHFELAHLWIDLGLSLLIGIYEFTVHLPRVIANFRALVDFPLGEQEQLKIMGCLARHFDEYEQIGRIYTTCKGARQVVEVELEFPTSMPVVALKQVEQRMKNSFSEEFPGGNFGFVRWLLRGDEMLPALFLEILGRRSW